MTGCGSVGVGVVGVGVGTGVGDGLGEGVGDAMQPRGWPWLSHGGACTTTSFCLKLLAPVGPVTTRVTFHVLYSA